MEDKNIHAGHRQRVYEEYFQGGLDSFSEVGVVELLLFYAYPRQDTDVLAHRLLERFGSLPRLFEATPEQLMSVPGVTRRAAVLLHLQTDVWRRYEISRSQTGSHFETTEDCGKYLLPFFQGARDEQVWVMCMDAKCKLLQCQRVCVGSVNSASIPTRKILELALAVNASVVVLAHNHTSGIALPSKQDIHTTQFIKQTLNAAEIVLADHLIIADDDYVSLAQSKLL